jgi:ATP-dependent Clp protease ATP-binding subunit ClpA
MPFSDLALDADSEADARTRALQAAEYRLAEMEGPLRSHLATETEPELAVIELEVAPEGGPERVAVTVGLVLYRRAARGDDVHLAYAPGVPNWVAVGHGRAEVLDAAKRSLEQYLGQWPVHAVLALDDVGAVSVEPVTIPFPIEVGQDEGERSGERLDCDDLTELAGLGRLGRLDRRDPLVERVLAVLAADGRGSVLLVGPSDVGKSTLVHELAARLGTGEVPPALQGRRLLRISANELIAGAVYAGEWQGRARQLIDLVRSSGAIVAMGDPSGIVDAGRHSTSDNNLSRVLRPYVERGDLRLILEATEDGVTAARRWEPSFIELFYRVDVAEPEVEAAREILGAAVKRIETNHGVAFAADAVSAALDLTRRFEPYRALPGKAVRLLEETAQLLTVEREHMLGREEINRAFAQRAGMPIAMLSDRVPLRIAEVRTFFEDRVLGQPEAVEEMVDLIAVIKAALNDPAKPACTLFFVGPTGVGKTELSKALAEFLFGSRERVLRFDMGEFASGDALPRLIGSAWDREGEGELIRRLREQPFCVLLLDEIEKAHHSVYDVLLSALGEARATDASGRTADLRNAIVIMTSNLGADRQESSLGFTRGEAEDDAARRRAHFVEEAERFFRPEFFNRLDRVVVFQALDRETIARIARREIGRLLMREGITRRQLLVEIDDRVVERLAEAGFHPRYGARPLKREIERAVIRPLARAIVEQRPTPGDLIRIEEAPGEVRLTVRRLHEPVPARRPPPAATPSQASLARAAERAAELLASVEAEAAGTAARATAAELSQLLDRVNDPAFWDDPAAAKTTLSRTYQLQRVADDLVGVRDRAEGLVELARQLRARRDRSRLSELRVALDEVAERLAVLRLECAAAAADGPSGEVVLTVSPVGGEAAEFADRLVAMYAAWAERTGREVAREANEPRRLTIAGPATGALLAGEAGLHRHDLPESRRRLARVEVGPASPGADALGDERQGDGLAVVVRVYEEGQRTGVRDPRTGVTVGNLRAVLEEGQIDEFVLATLASTAATSGAR